LHPAVNDDSPPDHGAYSCRIEFKEILKRRRMVRAYEPTPIPREMLERIVGTVRRAPSAGFSQGQRLVVVTEPERRRAIAAAVAEEQYVDQGFAPWISGAGALVFVCTPRRITTSATGSRTSSTGERRSTGRSRTGTLTPARQGC
jgi:hypothetical protein